MSGNSELKARYALVTGSSRGIGRAAAEALALSGCHVALVSRSMEAAEKAAADIRTREGVKVLADRCDVSDRESVRRLFLRLRGWSDDRLDILVCNAGYPFLKEIWDTPLHLTPADSIEDWYTGVFRTDTLGSILCTYEALPIMIKAGSGSIIYISSTPALAGCQGSPYTVAKAGILGLMKDVALQYGRYNIRANALALGSIMTPATTGQLDEESRRSFAEETPLKRWGQPEEAAEAILFLASARSSFVTGQTLVVDGGTVRR